MPSALALPATHAASRSHVLRAAACAAATLLGTMLAVRAEAQTISPPVVEYTERASSSFQVTNNGLTPLVVVLDLRGFVVHENGALTDVPLDTSRIKVQLSEMSFRLPARGTRTIFYEAKADTAPAWFQVIATFTGARAANGLNLRVELPHVVYLNQRAELAREDVVVRSVTHDRATKVVRVLLENTSGRLGRVTELNALGGTVTVEGGALPLFPRSKREVRLTWTDNTPPARIAAKFSGFTIDAPITP